MNPQIFNYLKIILIILGLFYTNTSFAILSPFLPNINTQEIKYKQKDTTIKAPHIPVEEIVYYHEKSQGQPMQATVIEYQSSLQIDNHPLRSVNIKEGQRLKTVKNSQAQIKINGVNLRIYSNSDVQLQELRSFDYHKEITFKLYKGRIRLSPGKKYVGALSIITPQETIISHNANLMVNLEKTKSVWSFDGSVEIITKDKKLIIMPGERADRRGSVWFVSALLSPSSLSKLKQKFALRGELKTDGTIVASHRYVKTVNGENLP